MFSFVMRKSPFGVGDLKEAEDLLSVCTFHPSETEGVLEAVFNRGLGLNKENPLTNYTVQNHREPMFVN